MTTKFTPGAWADRGKGCVGTTHQLIASVYPMEYERPEEHVANVRLIAAAPYLLEALIELADCGAEAWGEDRPCVKWARAAIARATGEQP